ncbi:MAG: helicase-exonuclease AddAB subunit AddA, partial [Clostridiales bacterium]|nr:helicase-exonuclease AddAB subunit AddA [Clostridiales bacterium]
MGWTEEQLQAINKRGANILVSAAAGSGKTSVLVERIITKVIEDKVDVDKILVVTFTSAAASEMKQRLLKALYKKIDEKPDDAYLQRQISLLNRANISTIHSFCLNMIKNNFYLLEMPANFRIGDTAEIEILKQEVIESIFEEKYENNDKEFLDLIRKYTTYSDDQNLKDLIIKIYEYSRCTPNPKKWIRESAEDFNFEEKIKNEDYSNKWTDILYKDLKETIIDSIEQLKKNKLKVEGIQTLEKVYDIYEEDIQSLEKIDTTTWDTMITGIKNKTWTRYVGNIKASEGEKAIKSELGEIRKNIKSKLTNIEFLSQKDAVLELNQMYPTLKYLANIIEEFDSRYTEAKHEKNIIDYSDLEHLSLKLLVDENNEKTEIANKYQFDEVLIDEYQDINEVQEKILTSVSNGKNTFMVGDVKQSIYRFRQSRPNIFIDKYINYKKAQKNDEKLEESTKILLYKNFRSRLEVLETTNIIFQSIMSKEFGEIEYNEEEYLNQGAEFEKNKLEDYSSELYIIDKNEEKIDGEIEEKAEKEEDGDEDKEIIENSAYEARLIAEKIKEFHKQGFKYSDMSILLRSVKSSAPVYEKELSERGIPVYSDAASEYIDSIEINTIISFLKIIDNPLQDIPLITVLRSPIIGLNDNELLEIRLLDKERKFYKALELSKNEKAIRFIEMLNKFKKDSLSMPLDELIWKIYMETGYFYYVRLMPGGKTRQANLKKLFETAKNYEQISFKGLFNFILFIEKITKTKNEFESAKVVGEKDDVVKIMSIHKSKGLEFPIVFVSGITKRVNESDYRTKIAYDQDLGFGIKYIDEISEYDTISKRALKIKSFKEMLAEEMRILYVALTRAKEKLVLVG